jgi:hypothetical protein
MPVAVNGVGRKVFYTSDHGEGRRYLHTSERRVDFLKRFEEHAYGSGWVVLAVGDFEDGLYILSSDPTRTAVRTTFINAREIEEVQATVVAESAFRASGVGTWDDAYARLSEAVERNAESSDQEFLDSLKWMLTELTCHRP